MISVSCYSYAEKDVKGDKNPKDFIIFDANDFSVRWTTKDNTGAVTTDDPKKQLIKTETNALTGNTEGSTSNTSATDAGGNNNGFGNAKGGEFDTTTAPSAGKGKPPVYNTDRRGPQ